MQAQQREEKTIKTILVVDDDKNIRLLLKAELTLQGYEVVLAGGGLEALRKIQEATPDLIILDIKMPDIHGLEVLRAIRKQDKELPVVICTAYEKMKDDYAVWSGQVAAYLTKPLDLEHLRNVVYELLHRQGQCGRTHET